MLQAISWSNYLEGAAILLACYYTGVGLIFYRQEITNLLTRTPIPQPAMATTAGDDTASFEALESIVHGIDSILEQAGPEATKDQLLPQLKQKMASYDGLRRPAYQVAVFNHIIKQAEEINGITILPQELEG